MVSLSGVFPTPLIFYLFSSSKRAIRILTFSTFDSHTSHLFFNLKLLKLFDLIALHNVYFMHYFFSNKLPSVFDDFFCSVSYRRSYNTRLASKKWFCLRKIILTMENYIFLFLVHSNPLKINQNLLLLTWSCILDFIFLVHYQ
jgi:hypothetical protein